MDLYTDEFFMKEALKEAEKAFEKNEIPIGAVIVYNNTIIARAHNLTESLTDVTAHAEMQAITAAANYLGGKYLNECTLYVTVEPCIMCAGASYWTQIGKIVFGANNIKKGFSNLHDTILHPKSKIHSGILEDDCSKILTIFFTNKRKQK